jgi:hypothetical protein
MADLHDQAGRHFENAAISYRRSERARAEGNHPEADKHAGDARSHMESGQKVRRSIPSGR